jgi:O-antigen/teichoic acid export membrane protein
MATIRKQAIISSILLYIGFLVGAINMYLYTKNGSFTKEQFGLTRVFMDFAQNFLAFGSLGFIQVMYKFYPYYKDNLPDNKNDLLGRAMLTALIGFVFILVCGLVFEPLVIRKFIEGSKLFLDYYYWVFLFGFGLLMFGVMEGFMWCIHKSVLSNFLKETVFRLLTTVLILLFCCRVIDFKTFMHIYSFLYLAIFLVLLVYLIKTGNFHLSFKQSVVSKKFGKKMLAMQSLIFTGTVVQTLGQTISGILLASKKGIGVAGIFTLAQYMANLVQVPQRSLQSAGTAILAEAWKKKDFAEIQRIYQRSCINMFLFAAFIFGNLALNAEAAIIKLNIQESYLAGVQVMLIIGFARLIDAGTGLNNIIIGTSNFWRFELFSGMILLALIIPLNYFLIERNGMIGSAYAEVISYTIFNFVRFEFLRRKYGMQPFNNKTFYAILLAAVAYALPYFLLKNYTGWAAMITKSFLFTTILIGGIFWLRLTPDAWQLYYRWVKKVK